MRWLMAFETADQFSVTYSSARRLRAEINESTHSAEQLPRMLARLGFCRAIER
jgi:hypothetical protein